MSGRGRRADTRCALDRGRESFHRRKWQDAYTELSHADADAGLGTADLERLATAAYLVGRDRECDALRERGHRECLRRGEDVAAARFAFWLGFGLLLRGDEVRAGGWLGRARRLLDDGRHDCPERGYLLVPLAIGELGGGDATAALATYERVGEIGERFTDPDLTALARLGRGEALADTGRTEDAAALFDEVMVAATAGELSPTVTGIAYCAVIEACQAISDLRRARAWTSALTQWCAAQPDLVPFRGQCLVHRAEILLLQGAWPEAADAARQACESLGAPAGAHGAEALGHPAAAGAFYQVGELHRLHGRVVEAEAAYRECSRRGRQPQPGLSLLRLAQGRGDVAAAALRRALAEASPLERPTLLAAHVEVLLAAGDTSAARRAADELTTLATPAHARLLHAMAARAQGAVLHAEGRPEDALGTLRAAWRTWQLLDVPYQAARVRVLLAMTCRDLGDDDAAEMELDAARRVFTALGAAPDVARVAALTRAPDPLCGLTEREVQVLRLVATGRTNRVIAAELVLSEKTVARHLANIFAKADLSSRAAATAWAYEHGLV
ncbi:LuxR C-terminal-related transcriptional regulator [Actinomycetospora lutea]|uniref:LuxR family transcriptional regulator n=1 Tax=Actinomycetospora lutea TaxID=663604 RepID=UPI002366FA00|nr:LuxR family transcriptional regulator [Actinomycetospora lutea]MDD7937175.1 LuxR C-terminal-related transcriptional regulator [Actinomycetospora lutea]